MTGDSGSEVDFVKPDSVASSKSNLKCNHKSSNYITRWSRLDIMIEVKLEYDVKKNA